jgi:L-threonine-O-3-phosphate decarboxylase
MKSIAKLAREEVRTLKPCVHGGEVWEVAAKYNLRVEDILDFGSNINPFGPVPGALESIKKVLWQIPFYPDSSSAALRKAIVQNFGRIGLSLSKENVIVGNGSTELIHLFAEIFIKKGEEGLIPIPTFGEYATAIRKAGGKPRYIRLPEDFVISAKSFTEKLTSATKVIFLCNPNNPTGTLIPPETLQKIIEKALEKEVLVFLDEDFMEFVEKETRFSLISKVEDYPNLFILRSFTKIYGLTGLRVGYGIASKEIINLLHRGKIPWNVNCLAQAAAIAVLKDKEEYLKETWRLLRKEKGFLLKELKQLKGFKVFPTSANFVLISIKKSGFTAAQLKDKLLRHGILIRDCSSFRGLNHYYIRIAIRKRQENEKLLKALKEVVGVKRS